ncbi:DNA-directed RNA polymerase subunit K [Candidatus Micrarchaeota archaeon]|nr:DNA-directed RNA polymerase subunit K [Candidatus Micrarchaeota archaeon]
MTERQLTLTRFELARVLGARALQVSMGAPIMLKNSGNLKNAADVAMRELEEGVLPLTVVRSLPGGSRELVNVSELYGKTKKQRAS